jgi:LacI family transcriptional regulator
MGVSAITVRRALTDLAAEGLLQGAQGRGVFVTERSRPPSGLISLIVPGHVDSPFLGAIRRGIDQALGSVTPLLVGISDGDAGREADLIDAMVARNVDGLFLVPVNGQRRIDADERMAAHVERGLRIVQVDRRVECPGTDFVASDHELSGWIAVNHLIDHGHRAIAYVHAHPCSTFAERGAGWRRALRERGLGEPPAEYDRGGTGRDDVPGYDECGYHRTLELFHLEREPTAIFAGNDGIAMGVLRALRFLGKRVPHDVSVIGTDDAELAATATPPLTTVRQELELIGKRAAETLMRRIADPTAAPDDYRIPTRLVKRDTVGPAPSTPA